MKNQILVLVCFIFFSCGIDFSKNTVRETNILGKVTKKYLDTINHGEPTIICKEQEEENKYQMSRWVKNSNLWDYLQIGDSVIKPSGTLTLRVKKEDGSFKDFEY